jgi:hypothetical protein
MQSQITRTTTRLDGSRPFTRPGEQIVPRPVVRTPLVLQTYVLQEKLPRRVDCATSSSSFVSNCPVCLGAGTVPCKVCEGTGLLKKGELGSY